MYSSIMKLVKADLRCIGSACCEYHSDYFIIFECKACKIDVSIKYATLLKAESYNIRDNVEKNVFAPLIAYHKGIHKKEITYEADVKEKRKEIVRKKHAKGQGGRYAPKFRSGDYIMLDSCKCKHCDGDLNMGGWANVELLNTHRWSSAYTSAKKAITNTVAKHLIAGCEEWKKTNNVNSDEARNNSEQYLRTMEFLSKQVEIKPKHKEIHGPKRLDNVLFWVEKSECGGFYKAGCNICKEVRSNYQKLRYAANTMYDDIMKFHFKRRGVKRSVLDLITPAHKTISKETWHEDSEDGAFIVSGFITRINSYKCIICGIEYESSKVPDTSLVISHFGKCMMVCKDRNNINRNVTMHNGKKSGTSCEVLSYLGTTIDAEDDREYFDEDIDDESDEDDSFV